MQVDAVDLRPLQDADVLEIPGAADDRLDHVAQHGNVSLDLILARPAGDQLGLFVESRIDDVRDVGQRFECGAGLFQVTQIDRQEVDVAGARQLGLAARDADHLPTRVKKSLDGRDAQQAACTCDQGLLRNVFALIGRAHDFNPRCLVSVCRA
jgi:hypothetical protein